MPMWCRYADVLVHRSLAASLGLVPLPESFKERELMADVVDNMNVRHTNAQHAGRSSVELHTRTFFRNNPKKADARVVKLQANGLIVFVPKYGIEGAVYFGEKDASTLHEHRQVGPRTSTLMPSFHLPTLFLYPFALGTHPSAPSEFTSARACWFAFCSMR
jgi:exoribonuclease R